MEQEIKLLHNVQLQCQVRMYIRNHVTIHKSFDSPHTDLYSNILYYQK